MPVRLETTGIAGGLERDRSGGRAELGQHRLHHGRMERVRRLQPARPDPGLRQDGLVGRDGLGCTGHDDELGAVQGRDRDAGRQRRQVRRIGRDRQHGSGLHLAHQAAAERDEAERLGQGQDAGLAGGRVIPDTVADHQVGADPPRAQQFGQRIMHDEEGDLRGLGPLQPRGLLL